MSSAAAAGTPPCRPLLARFRVGCCSPLRRTAPRSALSLGCLYSYSYSYFVLILCTHTLYSYFVRSALSLGCLWLSPAGWPDDTVYCTWPERNCGIADLECEDVLASTCWPWDSLAVGHVGHGYFQSRHIGHVRSALDCVLTHLYLHLYLNLYLCL